MGNNNIVMPVALNKYQIHISNIKPNLDSTTDYGGNYVTVERESLDNRPVRE